MARVLLKNEIEKLRFATHMHEITFVTDGTTLRCKILDASGRPLRRVQSLSIEFKAGEEQPVGKFFQLLEDEEGELLAKIMGEEIQFLSRTVYCDLVKIEHPDVNPDGMTREDFHAMYSEDLPEREE